jgi:hypothetical protein
MEAAAQSMNLDLVDQDTESRCDRLLARSGDCVGAQISMAPSLLCAVQFCGSSGA